MSPIEEYNEAIRAGSVTVSAKVAAVYKTLAHDVANGRGRWVYDQARAERPIAFVERFCRHSKGQWAGQPIKLELWQRAFIAALFGFIDPDTGERRFKEALLTMGRKCGKSVTAAAIALYCLLADNEPGAECYSIANKLDQAKLIFNEAVNMVRQSPELSALIKKRQTDMYSDLTMSVFKPLGKNANTLDGLNASFVVMDEIHASANRELYEVMRQSQSARRQPLLLMVSTMGTVRQSLFDDMYQYAEGVIAGTYDDPRFLAVVYELDSREEWDKPECWAKANPSLGSVKKIEDLRQRVERAKDMPQELPGLLCKDFCIRSSTSTAWLQFEDVNNEATFDIEQLRGMYAVGGADLSITQDLTCAALLVLDPATEERFVIEQFWMPEEGFEERVAREKIPFDVWHEQGLVRLCHGNTIRPADVTAWFVEMVEEHGITPAWVYYDAYSARYWVEDMEANGFNMVSCRQGAKTLSLPMQQMGADLKAKRINYNHNPVTLWCLTNTGIETDRNANIMPVKAMSVRQRIDGTAAMLDCYVGLTDHYNELVEL